SNAVEPRLERRRLDLERRHFASQPATGQLTIVLLAPARPADDLDEELHAVALLVLVVAEAVKHAQHGFGDAKDLGSRQELVQQAARRAQDRRAAAGGHVKRAPAVTAEHRAEAQVV